MSLCVVKHSVNLFLIIKLVVCLDNNNDDKAMTQSDKLENKQSVVVNACKKVISISQCMNHGKSAESLNHEETLPSLPSQNLGLEVGQATSSMIMTGGRAFPHKRLGFRRASMICVLSSYKKSGLCMLPSAAQIRTYRAPWMNGKLAGSLKGE